MEPGRPLPTVELENDSGEIVASKLPSQATHCPLLLVANPDESLQTDPRTR